MKTTKIRRNINGLILLDKPHGMSSNHALQKVKHLFHAQKAGHMGTLDPLASGMLPIALGQATKFSQYLLDAEKCYEVEAKLGERTSTQDAEGDITESHPVPDDLSIEKINELFNEFRGEITQVPSMYSALKHQGQPLYKLARAGIEVPRKERRVNIFEITISAYIAPIIYFSVHCSKGTYIRSLVDDFGLRLGSGAHVRNLRRTRVDHFQPENMLKLEDLQSEYREDDIKALDHYLLSPEVMVTHLPTITVCQEIIQKLSNGIKVKIEDSRIGLMQLFNEEHEFYGIAEIDENQFLLPKRLIFKDEGFKS
jgi:tRNA pseudouridine55 synthase